MSFVASSRIGRRSPRRPPGRTCRSRRCGSGCAAGGTATTKDRASLACLEERCSRPHRSPRRVPADEERRICELRERTGWSPRRLADEPEIARSHSTVHRVLQRAGVSRRPQPERPTVVRYLWPCPGQLLHMDTKKLGKFEQPGHALTGDRQRRSRRVGWEYVHSIVDDASRLAYSEIHDDETAPTVTAFTERALDCFLDHGIVTERLMTDNAFAYIHNKTLARAALRGARSDHLRTRPYTPRTNGKVERYQQTLQREWAYAHGIRLKPSPSRLTATLGAPLQRAAHPQRHRQPPSHPTRSGGHRAQQLDGARVDPPASSARACSRAHTREPSTRLPARRDTLAGATGVHQSERLSAGFCSVPTRTPARRRPCFRIAWRSGSRRRSGTCSRVSSSPIVCRSTYERLAARAKQEPDRRWRRRSPAWRACGCSANACA